MQKFFPLATVAIFTTLFSFSQSVSINNNGSPAAPSAILDVSSSIKGLLIPRMNTVNILSLSNPDKGLLVYDSVKNQLMVNMGTASIPNWQTIVNKSAWALAGNSGTDTSINFVGTADKKPFLIKVNNQPTGMFDTSNNIFLGTNAGILNPGFDNIAIGRNAYGNGSGGEQIAIGVNALSANHTGIWNSAIGSYALQLHRTGNRNTALGYAAMDSDTSGISNTAIGFMSMHSNLSGTHNTSVGTNALLSNITGTNNTAVGEQSLFINLYGQNNTAIGYLADVQNNSLSNTTAIGANAKVGVSNTIQLGDPNVTTVNTYGSITVLNGKGLIRSVDGTQLKKLNTTVTVNATIPAGASINIPFSFPESFSAAPDVYVGNVTGGAGGFAEVIMSVANVSTTGGSLFINNPRAGSFSPNFVVKIIAIGPQ